MDKLIEKASQDNKGITYYMASDIYEDLYCNNKLDFVNKLIYLKQLYNIDFNQNDEDYILSIKECLLILTEELYITNENDIEKENEIRNKIDYLSALTTKEHAINKIMYMIDVIEIVKQNNDKTAIRELHKIERQLLDIYNEANQKVKETMATYYFKKHAIDNCHKFTLEKPTHKAIENDRLYY